MTDATPLLSNHVRQQDFAWKQLPPSGGTKDQYVNEIDVEQGEHDVTLVCKRRLAQVGSPMTVARITMPKSLWEELVK
jgi:hypothetical protein